jgi:hypothetical protein
MSASLECTTTGVLPLANGSSTTLTFSCPGLPPVPSPSSYDVQLTRVVNTDNTQAIQFKFKLPQVSTDALQDATLNLGSSSPTPIFTTELIKSYNSASEQVVSTYINRTASVVLVGVSNVDPTLSRVEVYTPSGTTYTLKQSIPAVLRRVDNTSTQLAVVSDDGSTIFIMNYNSLIGAIPYSIDVYRLSGGQYGKITNLVPPANTQFQPSLAILADSTTILVVGTSAVYKLEQQGNFWVLVGTFPYVGGVNAFNPLPVMTNADASTISLGVLSTTDIGSVYTYNNNNVRIITNGNATLGAALATNNSGQFLAISQPKLSSSSTIIPAVIIYAQDDTGAYQLQQILSDVSGNSLYGYSIAMSADGNYLVVASPANTSPVTNQNVIFYQRTGGTWSEVFRTSGLANGLQYVSTSSDGAVTASSSFGAFSIIRRTGGGTVSSTSGVSISANANVTAKYTSQIPASKHILFKVLSDQYTYVFDFNDDQFSSVTATVSTTYQTLSVVGSPNSIAEMFVSSNLVAGMNMTPNSNIMNMYAYNEFPSTGSGPTPAQCNFNRPLVPGPSNTGNTGCVCCGGESDPNNPNLTRAPRIYMTIQTTLTGSDIAQMLFAICDDFDYNKNKLRYSQCDQNRFIPRSSIITSNFNLISFYISCVVVGIGDGLTEKIKYLHSIGKTNVDLMTLTTYAGAKLILMEAIHGEFNRKYLLRSYNTQFFKDLENSRFCRFVNFFLCPQFEGFRKFFKYEFDGDRGCLVPCNDRFNCCDDRHCDKPDKPWDKPCDRSWDKPWDKPCDRPWDSPQDKHYIEYENKTSKREDWKGKQYRKDRKDKKYKTKYSHCSSCNSCNGYRY